MKPKVFVFSIIPRLGEIVKQLLPSEDVTIVKYQASMSEKYGRVVSQDEIDQLKDAEILLSDNNAFVQMTDQLPNLKWFQGTWAGVEALAAHFRAKSSPPPYQLTRMSNDTFCQLMAEYVVGQIIVNERGWRQADKYQGESEWAHHGRIATYRSLRDLSVTVLGTGNIGRAICGALKVFQCRVVGYSRTAATDELACAGLLDQHLHGAEGLPCAVKEADYLVSCLPSTPLTAGILSPELLATVKSGCVLINLGRGDAVTEETLLGALDAPNSTLAGAVLDVFAQEPLPKTSPLWLHPKVVLTPHCAGVSRVQDVAALFADNYARYNTNRPLLHPVDLSRGY